MHAVKSYLPERGVFYRAVKVMEFLAPTNSLLLKDKHIKFYKVRNSVTWSVLWATISPHTVPRLCFFLRVKNFKQPTFSLKERVSVRAIYWLKMSPNGEGPNIFDQHSLPDEITRISLPLIWSQLIGFMAASQYPQPDRLFASSWISA